MAQTLEKISILPAREEPSMGLTPMDMLGRAVTAGADIDVLEKLMALQERYESNQGRKAFDNALASAKSEIPVIFKNRTVDFTSQKGRTHYKHEDLAEIARTVTPILAKHGLSYRFRTTSAPNEPVTVTCIVSHRDGHFEENTLCAGRDDSGNNNCIQAVGSTLTYLQRMTLKAALGLAASDDDDGETADLVGGLVTEEQLTELVNLADDVKADKAKFCAYLQVPSLAAIKFKDFQRAKDALNAKRARR
jgi:hypothetical protein